MQWNSAEKILFYSYHILSPFSSLLLSTEKNSALISQFRDHSANGSDLLISSIAPFLFSRFLFRPGRPISWPFVCLFRHSLYVFYFFQFFSFNLKGGTFSSLLIYIPNFFLSRTSGSPFCVTYSLIVNGVGVGMPPFCTFQLFWTCIADVSL